MKYKILQNNNMFEYKFNIYFRNVSLDGNPQAAEHFHRLIEKDDSK